MMTHLTDSRCVQFEPTTSSLDTAKIADIQHEQFAQSCMGIGDISR